MPLAYSDITELPNETLLSADSAHKKDARSTPPSITAFIAVTIAGLYASAVCAHGIPSLRHDWLWAPTRHAFISAFWQSTAGWSTSGIGSPQPYPGAYVVGTAIAAIGLLLGPFAALVIFSLFIGLVVVLASGALSRRLGASQFQTAALQLFSIANPWVYNETVAGHTYMVLAYGALFGLVAELLKRRSRTVCIALFLLLTLSQLQFFLIALVCVAVHAIARRTLTPLFTGILLGLPIWIGLLLERGSLLTTPYTLAWQLSQSVPSIPAIILRGYFTHYADGIAGIQTPSLWLLVCCAVLGLAFSRTRRISWVAAIIGAFFLCISMGVLGPMGSVYATIVTHVPESGLFRELYDLIGCVAVVYVMLLALGPRWRWLIGIEMLAAVFLFAAWIGSPPSRYWVSSADYPLLSFDAPTNSRFALMPAFQPLRLENRGSGPDRDAYARPGNVTPINQYLPGYPVDSGLAAALRDGDVSALSGLSVSTIIMRPWLATNEHSLAFPTSMNRAFPQHPNVYVRHLNYTPEMTLGQMPLLGSLVSQIGSGNELFSDAGPGVIKPVRSSNTYVREKDGWVDVRFDFISHPELAQAIGGVVTTNSHALLRIQPAPLTLVNISGALYAANGRRIFGNTRGYRWLAVPRGVQRVRCSGRCVVAAQTFRHVVPSLNPPPRAFTRLPFRFIAPWFVSAAVLPGPRQSLRYNVAFDPHWVAFFRGKVLRHERIDAAVNGWVVPQRSKGGTIYIVHLTSALQSFAEVMAVLWIVLLLAAALIQSRSRVSRAAALYEDPA